MSTFKQRDGGKEQFWRRMIQLWPKSGLSVRAFCAAQGLEEASFYGWRRTIAQRDRQAVSFVPVRVRAEPKPVADADGCSGLELVLGQGRRLRIAPTFDADTLRRLLATLEVNQEGRP